MKKLLIVAILMLALVVTIAACTNEETPVDTDAVTTAGENATVADPAETTEASAETTEAPAEETTEPETETTEAPAEPVLVIDPRTLAAGAITGHEPNIVDSTDTTGHFAMIQAAGLESGAMIHQGSIYIGEYDLTQYSKVVIYFATDWSEGTQSALAAAKDQGFGYLGLSAIDCNNVVNPDRAYFIGELYNPDGGWTITAHELPNVAASGYSGPVYVAADFLAGQFIIIDRVEFYA